jgi:hypothetical protein
MMGIKSMHKNTPRMRGDHFPQGSGSKDRGRVAKAVITKAKANPMAAATMVGNDTNRGSERIRFLSNRQGRMVSKGASK